MLQLSVSDLMQIIGEKEVELWVLRAQRQDAAAPAAATAVTDPHVSLLRPTPPPPGATVTRVRDA